MCDLNEIRQLNKRLFTNLVLCKYFISIINKLLGSILAGDELIFFRDEILKGFKIKTQTVKILGMKQENVSVSFFRYPHV